MRNKIIKQFLACVATVLVLYGVLNQNVPVKELLPPAVVEKKEEEQVSAFSDEAQVMTLNQFLAGLKCGGCRRGCSLLSPRCIRGQSKAYQAEQEYNMLYVS